jgi:hypothetical protein
MDTQPPLVMWQIVSLTTHIILDSITFGRIVPCRKAAKVISNNSGNPETVVSSWCHNEILHKALDSCVIISSTYVFQN